MIFLNQGSMLLFNFIGTVYIKELNAVLYIFFFIEQPKQSIDS